MSQEPDPLEELLMDTLAYNMKTMRRDRKWSQKDLANRVDVNRVTIARIELGGRMPSWGLVCKIADAFEVSVDELRIVSKKLQNVG